MYIHGCAIGTLRCCIAGRIYSMLCCAIGMHMKYLRASLTYSALVNYTIEYSRIAQG